LIFNLCFYLPRGGEISRTSPSFSFGASWLARKQGGNQIGTKIVSCPECGSQRNYKDGMRYTRTKEIKRHLCRECGPLVLMTNQNFLFFSNVLILVAC
jgi:RNase P subunit RPR2